LGAHELIDLSADTCIIDVDSFICEVLLVDVLSAKIKIDPDTAEQQRIRLPKPAPMVIKVKLEPGANKRQKLSTERAGVAKRRTPLEKCGN
jgi:hypothetical protein